MGPFIPKKNEEIVEEGGRNRRRRPRPTISWNFDDDSFTVTIPEPVLPRTRPHRGRWVEPDCTHVECRDCDFRTNDYHPYSSRASAEWVRHQETSPRLLREDG